MTKFKEGTLVLLLRDGRFDEFNHAAGQEDHLDLAGANLRGVDLRRATLRNADLRNAYCHTADFRGVDLSQANLEGASFHRARISGAWFPSNISAEELKMSVDLGTRIRLRSPTTPKGEPGRSASAIARSLKDRAKPQLR